jgi:hypothetical protein
VEAGPGQGPAAAVVDAPEVVDGPGAAEALARHRLVVVVAAGVGLVRRGHRRAQIAQVLHDPTVRPQRPA